jgi:hypothetical protein
VWFLMRLNMTSFYHPSDRWIICRDGVYSLFIVFLQVWISHRLLEHLWVSILRMPVIIFFSNSDRKRRLSQFQHSCECYIMMENFGEIKVYWQMFIMPHILCGFLTAM